MFGQSRIVLPGLGADDSQGDRNDQQQAEIKRRIEEIDNATVELIPLAAVREKLDRIRND